MAQNLDLSVRKNKELSEVYVTLSFIPVLFQTKKCHFLHSFSDLAFKKSFHHYFSLKQEQRVLEIYFEFASFSFFLTYLELKR